jgi:hypothetical protein
MSEKDHYKFGLSRRGKNVNDNNTLADDLRERIRELEAALKLGWKVAIGTSYDGACDCATCAPVREFLKTVEALTAAETSVEYRQTIDPPGGWADDTSKIKGEQSG